MTALTESNQYIFCQTEKTFRCIEALLSTSIVIDISTITILKRDLPATWKGSTIRETMKAHCPIGIRLSLS